MLIRCQALFSNSLYQVSEVLGLFQTSPQGQRVDKEAYQIFDLTFLPIRYRSADDNVFLSSIALYRGSGLVRRQFQKGWCALQLLSPVTKLFVQQSSTKLPSLPKRIVGILNLQFRQR